MPVPTAYTEQELAEYMHAELQDVALDLEMTPVLLGSYAQAVINTLIAYGESDISTITTLTNIAKLRAFARVQAWKVAQARATARYDMSDGTQSLKRSQMFGMIDKALAAAERDAQPYGGGNAPVVAIGGIRWAQDPYGPPSTTSGG